MNSGKMFAFTIIKRVTVIHYRCPGIELHLFSCIYFTLDVVGSRKFQKRLPNQAKKPRSLIKSQ